MDLYLLRLPFKLKDLEYRVQMAVEREGQISAMILTYVTNRAIMDRLDSVVGPENWKNEYKPGPDGGIVCGLSILVSGEWVTKWDGAENSNFESVKGGLSNAMKRAAVQWGIGRYLYNLQETWVKEDANGKIYQRKSGNTRPFKYMPPAMPDWGMPCGFDKMQYLHNPLLSYDERDYIVTHPLTDEVKQRLDKKLQERAK